MKDNKSFKAGDKIVKFGQVYRIFKIERKKSDSNKDEKIIFYKPYPKNRQNDNLVCSIPVENIEIAHIRRPISKKQLKKLLEGLSRKPESDMPINTVNAREKLSLNDPQITVKIMKKIWTNNNGKLSNLSKAQRDVFELSMKRLVEEVAFVGNTSLSIARKKIKKHLRKLNEQ